MGIATRPAKRLNTTDWIRIVLVSLYVVTVITALGGWLILGRDPEQLDEIITALTGGVLVGEASNIGKRATFKVEAVGSEGE